MTSSPAPSFEAVVTDVMRLFREEAYEEAQRLLTELGDRFPDRAPMVLYLRSCVAVRRDQPEQAVRLLQAAADQGFWYSERVLRESPSFQPLQGLPAFEALVPVFTARHAAVPREPHRIVVEPPGDTAGRRTPLFMALHGNGDNATNSVTAWRPLADDGWLVAALQSSQIEMMDGYVWDDQDLARREIETHNKALRQEHDIDEDRSIIAGFSMGGELALRLALDGSVPVRGFVLLAPSGPPQADDWLPLIQQAPRGLRGYVILGADDDGIAAEPVHALVDHLNAHGIACRLQLLPGVGHEYPPDLASIARRAVTFINS